MKEKAKKFALNAYKFSNSWTGTIIIVLLVIFFIAQAFRIPSGSMKYSLLVGDHLFAKKFAYGISTPHLPFLEIPLIPGTDGLLHISKVASERVNKVEDYLKMGDKIPVRVGNIDPRSRKISLERSDI